MRPQQDFSSGPPTDFVAPPGTVWVCGTCGKRAKHRVDGGIDAGWDTSCFTWAVLCEEASLVFDAHGVLRGGKAVKK